MRSTSLVWRALHRDLGFATSQTAIPRTAMPSIDSRDPSHAPADGAQPLRRIGLAASLDLKRKAAPRARPAIEETPRSAAVSPSTESIESRAGWIVAIASLLIMSIGFGTPYVVVV